MPDLSREEREALRAWAADHNAARPTAATLSAVVAALDALDAAEQRAEKAEAEVERLKAPWLCDCHTWPGPDEAHAYIVALEADAERQKQHAYNMQDVLALLTPEEPDA